jgi:hypothetical protein
MLNAYEAFLLAIFSGPPLQLYPCTIL